MLEYCIAFIFDKSKIQNNKLQKLFIIHLLLLLTGYILSQNMEEDYFAISHILISSFFFFIGYIYNNMIKEKNNVFIPIIALLLGAVFCFINERIKYSGLKFGNPVLSLASCLLTIFGIFELTNYYYKKTKKDSIKNSMELLGKNTIIVLVTHLILVDIIRMIERYLHMEIHTFPTIVSFFIIIISETIIIKFMPKKILKIFGK